LPSLRYSSSRFVVVSRRREGRLADLSAVIARFNRAIQYSETVRLESRGRGVLDCPLPRAMTAESRTSCLPLVIASAATCPPKPIERRRKQSRLSLLKNSGSRRCARDDGDTQLPPRVARPKGRDDGNAVSSSRRHRVRVMQTVRPHQCKGAGKAGRQLAPAVPVRKECTGQEPQV